VYLPPLEVRSIGGRCGGKRGKSDPVLSKGAGEEDFPSITPFRKCSPHGRGRGGRGYTQAVLLYQIRSRGVEVLHHTVGRRKEGEKERKKFIPDFCRIPPCSVASSLETKKRGGEEEKKKGKRKKRKNRGFLIFDSSQRSKKGPNFHTFLI